MTMFVLARLPWRKSFFLQVLMALAVGQLLLGLWLAGAIDREIGRTENFASKAKWVTVQMKEEASSLFVKPLLTEELGEKTITIETVKADEILSRLEVEEPEVAQTVKAMGNEGIQLMPWVLVVRGLISDSTLERLKQLPKTQPDIYRVGISPIHHTRLLSFYAHLRLEVRVAAGVLIFLLAVLLLGLQRIEVRDLNDARQNLIVWGASRIQAQTPLLIVLSSVVGLGLVFSGIEWVIFKKKFWSQQSFLGELSIDHRFVFPELGAAAVLIGVLVWIFFLSFSGSTKEE